MSSKFLSLLSVVTLASLLSPAIAGAEAPKTGAKDAILANINGTVITVGDFEARYQDNLRYFQAGAPEKKAVLEDIIRRELAVQEAKKLGLDKDPMVTERMNTVLFQALLDKQLAKDVEKITVSDGEAESNYKKNPEIRTSHIFIALLPGATAEQESAARKRMAAIQDELKRGASFAEVAQKQSEGPAAPMGGDIDYKDRSSLDPAYYSAALALGSPGKMSGVVRTPFGLHLIKLTAVRDWEDADHGMVKRRIFDQKRAALFEKYMDRLRQGSKVSINSALLKN